MLWLVKGAVKVPLYRGLAEVELVEGDGRVAAPDTAAALPWRRLHHTPMMPVDQEGGSVKKSQPVPTVREAREPAHDDHLYAPERRGARSWSEGPAVLSRNDTCCREPPTLYPSSFLWYEVAQVERVDGGR